MESSEILQFQSIMESIEKATKCTPGHFSKLPIFLSEAVMLLTWVLCFSSQGTRLCDSCVRCKAFHYAEICVNPGKANAGLWEWILEVLGNREGEMDKKWIHTA